MSVSRNLTFDSLYIYKRSDGVKVCVLNDIADHLAVRALLKQKNINCEITTATGEIALYQTLLEYKRGRIRIESKSAASLGNTLFSKPIEITKLNEKIIDLGKRFDKLQVNNNDEIIRLNKDITDLEQALLMLQTKFPDAKAFPLFTSVLSKGHGKLFNSINLSRNAKSGEQKEKNAVLHNRPK